MTKPVTVADAMRNLAEAITPTKPAPVEVKIVEPKLIGGTELLQFLLGNILLWNLRALAVWGFLAVFFPALGTTYLMVLLGLWVLRHVIPTDPADMVKRIAATRK